jgi:hypothetical protein
VQAEPVQNFRGGGPGRRVDDTGRLWPFYLSIVVQLVVIVWMASNYAATINRVSVQLDRVVITQEQQNIAIGVLNCKTAITCRVTAEDATK